MNSFIGFEIYKYLCDQHSNGCIEHLCQPWYMTGVPEALHHLWGHSWWPSRQLWWRDTSIQVMSRSLGMVIAVIIFYFSVTKHFHLYYLSTSFQMMMRVIIISSITTIIPDTDTCSYWYLCYEAQISLHLIPSTTFEGRYYFIVEETKAKRG